MKARHARDIRHGIIEARDRPPRPNSLVILNSRIYSELAFYAFNEYRRRHANTR